MTKNELLETIKNNMRTPLAERNIIDAVESYTEASNGAKLHVSGALPPVIYVEQGNSSLGKDSEGREYYIKHVSSNER